MRGARAAAFGAAASSQATGRPCQSRAHAQICARIGAFLRFPQGLPHCPKQPAAPPQNGGPRGRNAAMLRAWAGETAITMAEEKEPITIKKYANRRLYNTGTSTYVTLEDLAAMVKNGEDFVVYDAKTGEDITRSVLAQIIFEQENKEGQSLLPIAFLRQLIRFYGDSMQMLVPRYLEQSIDRSPASRTNSASRWRRPSASAASARSRSRCGGTWKCSRRPSPCSRPSRAAQGQARRREKPQGGGRRDGRAQAPARRDAEAARPARQ